MELKDIKSAIEKRKKAVFNGGKYIVTGYKLEVNKFGEKLYSVGLQERKGMQSLVWAKFQDVELE